MPMDFLTKFAMSRSGTLPEIHLSAPPWMLMNTGRTFSESGGFRIELGTLMTGFRNSNSSCVRPAAARFR